MSDIRPNEEIPTHESPAIPAEQRVGMIATGFIITAVLAVALYWSA